MEGNEVKQIQIDGEIYWTVTSFNKADIELVLSYAIKMIETFECCSSLGKDL